MKYRSNMFKRGYEDAAIQFSYIPNFKNDTEKKDYEAGLKAGYAKRNTECSYSA